MDPLHKPFESDFSDEKLNGTIGVKPRALLGALQDLILCQTKRKVKNDKNNVTVKY